MRSIMMMALACCPAMTLAADGPPRIVVSGSGRVTTPPDLVTIDYGVRGEGATSDAAVAALVARRRAIDAGLATVTDAPSSASSLSVTEVRASGCKRDDDDPRLSTGGCAIVGYIAAVAMRLRTGDVKASGTIVGLLGRLQADNPRLDGIMLADPEAAERRAMAAALVDARRKAEAIAARTGVKLGRLIIATGGDRGNSAGDIIVTGQRRLSAGAIMPPPIVVDLTLRPIETQAQVSVTYEIAP